MVTSSLPVYDFHLIVLIMHIISKKILQQFWEEHPSAEAPLRIWFTRGTQAQWHNFAELRRDYPSADLVGRFTVFNIGVTITV